MWTLILLVTAGYMKEGKNPSVTLTTVPGFETSAACQKAGSDATAAFRITDGWNNTVIVNARYTCAMLNKG